MPFTREHVIDAVVLMNALVGVLFLTYHGGCWVYQTFRRETPQQENAGNADTGYPPPTFHTSPEITPSSGKGLSYTVITHKNDREDNSQGEDLQEEGTPITPRPEDPGATNRKIDGGGLPDTSTDGAAMMVEAILKRLTEKLEKGEITHVVRWQYQCLVEDKIRWGLMEKELKEAMTEELDVRLRQTQADTETLMSGHREISAALSGQQQMTTQLDQRLQDLDSRMALEPHILEIRGFMKIETFGPVLLMMGVLEMLMMTCLCLVFLRQR